MRNRGPRRRRSWSRSGAATLAFVERVETEPVEAIVAVPRLVAGSRALRDRLFLRLGAGGEPSSRRSSPRRPARPRATSSPAVVARTLAWTHRLVFRAAFQRLLAGEDQRVVAADLRDQARRAYEALEQGLAGCGVRRF